MRGDRTALRALMALTARTVNTVATAGTVVTVVGVFCNVVTMHSNDMVLYLNVPQSPVCQGSRSQPQGKIFTTLNVNIRILCDIVSYNLATVKILQIKCHESLPLKK